MRNPFLHPTRRANPAVSSPSSARIFAVASYDPETLRMVTDAFDEAWMEYRALLHVEPIDADATCSAMAKRIMAAVHEGECDPAQLKWIALKAN